MDMFSGGLMSTSHHLASSECCSRRPWSRAGTLWNKSKSQKTQLLVLQQNLELFEILPFQAFVTKKTSKTIFIGVSCSFVPVYGHAQLVQCDTISNLLKINLSSRLNQFKNDLPPLLHNKQPSHQVLFTFNYTTSTILASLVACV